MSNNTLLIVSIAIIILVVLGYFAFKGTTTRNKISIITTATTPTLPPSQTQCQQYQLAATIIVQGAAGNIYGTLKLTNASKTACIVSLGNTVIASSEAKNIIIQYQKNVPSENFLIAPLSVVYSQFHFPNGPQCQSGISPKKISFSYKSGQTVILFPTTTQSMGKLMIQTCSSPLEKTIIDIWPLSKTPITL